MHRVRFFLPGKKSCSAPAIFRPKPDSFLYIIFTILTQKKADVNAPVLSAVGGFHIFKYSNDIWYQVGTFHLPGSFMSATAIPAIASVAPVSLPIPPIIAAVEAAIAAVILIVKNWGAISKWFKGVWETVCKGVEDIGKGLRDFFSGLWDGTKSVTENSLEWN